MVASPSDECSAWTWKSPAYQPASCAGRRRRRRARAHMGPPPTADRSRASISTRHATRPSESPSSCDATAATPSSTAHSPAGIGPGTEAARRRPGGGAAGSRGTAPRSRSPLRRHGHVRVARSAPAAELRLGPRRVPARDAPPTARGRAVLDLRVRGRLGLVAAVAHPHGRRAGRHVEREHHVGALERGVELSRDHAMGLEGGIGCTGARCRGRGDAAAG